MMSFNNSNSPPREGRNVWSAGSRGSHGGFGRSDDDNNGMRGGGSFRNNFSKRGGGGYGFRRNNSNNADGGDNEVEILHDTIFIQNLPKDITRDDLHEAFSVVGTIRTDERSGGPKIWLYKDRMTGEGNGRATVAYESPEIANEAIAQFNDQHINSIDCVVRVQLAQRRIRNNDDNDRGGFHNNRGYRGGRSNWNNQSGPGFNAGGNGRWVNRGGGGFRGRGSGDRGGSGGSYRGNRGNSYRGSNRGNGNPSNYSPN